MPLFVALYLSRELWTHSDSLSHGIHGDFEAVNLVSSCRRGQQVLTEDSAFSMAKGVIGSDK